MITEATDKNFSEAISSGVVLVDFWAPWCGPCRALAPILDQVAQEVGDQVKIVKVNVDENPMTPGQFGIQSIPTVLIFKDGEIVDTLVGLQSKEALLKSLQAAL